MPRLLVSLLAFLVLSLPLRGQDTVLDVASALSLTSVNTTPIVTVTASQGDGSKCTLAKIPGPAIAFASICQTAAGIVTVPTLVTRSAPPVSGTVFLATLASATQAGVLCLVALNGNSSAVPAGSFGNVPAQGIAYQCTTNITAGGQTTPVAGTMVWP